MILLNTLRIYLRNKYASSIVLFRRFILDIQDKLVLTFLYSVNGLVFFTNPLTSYKKVRTSLSPFLLVQRPVKLACCITCCFNWGCFSLRRSSVAGLDRRTLFVVTLRSKRFRIAGNLGLRRHTFLSIVRTIINIILAWLRVTMSQITTGGSFIDKSWIIWALFVLLMSLWLVTNTAKSTMSVSGGRWQL